MKFFPNIVVWGESYVHSFLKTTLPTLLAPGNLPSLKEFPGSIFYIVCPNKEEKIIRKSEGFARLSSEIEVKFIPLDWNLKEAQQPILNLSRGHRLICEAIADDFGYAVFLSPDCLLSESTFLGLIRYAKNGARAVLAPGFRLIKDRTEFAFSSITRNGVAAISGTAMVRLFIENMHSEMLGYFVNSPYFTRHPVYCFWPFEDGKSLLMRAFHLHPLMVQVSPMSNFSSLEYDTIDGDFVGPIVGDLNKVTIVPDLKEIAIFSMSPEDERASTQVRHAFQPKHVAWWAYCFMNTAVHRHNFLSPILISADEVDEAEYSVLVERSARESLDILNHPSPVKYVGYSHELIKGEATLQGFPSLELFDELKMRLRQSDFRKFLGAIKIILFRKRTKR